MGFDNEPKATDIDSKVEHSVVNTDLRKVIITNKTISPPSSIIKYIADVQPGLKTYFSFQETK